MTTAYSYAADERRATFHIASSKPERRASPLPINVYPFHGRLTNFMSWTINVFHVMSASCLPDAIL
jgi:hypothetical protein